MNRDEIKKILANDPFLKLWEENYNENCRLGYLSKVNTKPLAFLTHTGIYNSIPVVLVVAGPSLDKNIHHLKEYVNNCIIVCADVVMFKLLENGITPDFVVNIDPHESISRFFEKCDTSNSTLVCPVTTNPKTLEIWRGNIFFYIQDDVKESAKGQTLKRISKNIKSWGTIVNRYFVGAAMLQFAAVLNPSVVILVGYDFAYTDDKPYCDGFMDIKLVHTENPVGSEEHTKMIEKLKSLEMKKELEIKVSADKSVWTSRTLNLYKVTLLRLMQIMKFPIINSTEGGILLEITRIALKSSLNSYCTEPIEKFKEYTVQKRKKRRKR